MIAFTVYGEPVAQGRPRASTINGMVRMYDPKKSKDFKQIVKLVAQDYAPTQLLEGPLLLEVKVFKSSLKSFSNKKKLQAEQGILRPTSKPDVDNYVKGIKDACNKVLWKDDSQVVELRVSKWYSEKPRIEVAVQLLDEEKQLTIL
ncbi:MULTISPECIES: RusA family crossover junction endodeoxyribonuclease [Ectobacillus]|uniref:RusA family crossover junction endodeoxyribonuclease n=1 Tax=Ectobacillus TaxID=2837502 RepID=UPI000F59FF25|nr:MULTISPECIES: RusA family crossover junction endodeoxyribonuclease [Ectobacillus]UOY92882.1 RusA family crossover junction endodeoxyribonuclease [Ectobacillus sp. JY-23]